MMDSQTLEKATLRKLSRCCTHSDGSEITEEEEEEEQQQRDYASDQTSGYDLERNMQWVQLFFSCA